MDHDSLTRFTAPVTARPDEDTYIHIPELPGLLPVAYHPQAAQIEFRSNGWLRRFTEEYFGDESALLGYLRQRNGLFGPVIMPYADTESCQAITDFFHLVALIDDDSANRSASESGLLQAREVFPQILASFAHGVTASEDIPYGQAVQNLWQRISPGLTQPQMERFHGGLEKFLRASAAEVPYRQSHTAPDMDTYLAIRQESFCFDLMLVLIEYALGIDMSDVAETGMLDELHDHAIRQLIFVNDVMSLRREYAQGDTLNAVQLLRYNEHLPIQEAVDSIYREIEKHERTYVAARDELLHGRVDAELRAYITGVDHLLSGCQEFQYLTPRYYGDGAVWDGSTSGWINLTEPIARFHKEKS